MRRFCQLLLLAVAALPAAAQESARLTPLELTPGSADLSTSILHNIFGEWGGSAWVPTVGAAFSIMNAGLLVVGAALFAYTATVGMIHSAHDGEVLGKKWSTMWVPARLAGAIALLMPTSSGFSIIQLLILWVASQGIGLANAIWSQASNSFTLQQGSIVAVRFLEADAVAPAMRQILKAEICTEQMRRSMPGTQAGLTDATRFSSINATVTSDADHIAAAGIPGTSPTEYQSGSRQGRENLTAYTSGYISWGGRAPWSDVMTNGVRETMVPRDACAVVELPTRTFIDRAQGDLSEAESVMIRAQANAIITAAAMLRPVAARIIDAEAGPGADLDADVADALTRAGKTYVANVQQESQALADRAYSYLTNAIKNDAESGNGWLTAGAWYYQMARINSEVAKSVQWAPVLKNIPVSNEHGGGGLSRQYDDWINGIPLPELEMRKPIVLGQTSGAFGNRQGGLGGAFNTGAASDGIVAAGMRTIGFDPTNSAHPVLQVKDTGDHLMGAIEGILIAAGMKDVVIELTKKFVPAGRVVEAVGGAVSKVKGSAIGSAAVESLKGALSSTGLLLTSALAALFVIAIMMSLYIPLLPFILWVGAVVGYFVNVFVYVCAAPVWMAAHIHPEGDGLAGKWGAQGYAILVDVLARPALMILGLVGSLVVLPPVMSILFGTFQNAAGSMQADSISGAVTWLVLITVYSFLCVTIVHKVVALITIVPNRVPELLGLTRTAPADEG